MKIRKLFDFGVLVLAAVLLSACGNTSVRPPKQSEISVGDIDIETGKNGRLVVSRKGERFKPCGKDCNIFNEQVKVESIKTISKGLGCSTAVTLLEYQVPLERMQNTGEPGKVPATDVRLETGKLRKTTSDSKLEGRLSSPVNSSETAKKKTPLYAMQLRYTPWYCRPVRSITEENGCCSFFYATNASGSGQILPRKEDPDCSDYF